MIVFDCPACRSKLQVADEHAGKLMRCPSCQQTAPIPSADASAVAAEPIAPPPPAPPVALPAPSWDQADGNDPDERAEDRPRRRRRRERDQRDDRDDDRSPPRSSGIPVAVTLVLVGVGACLVGAILLGLLIPAVSKVRESAARAQSTNNLKQIALGFQSFHDAYKHLPFNGSDDRLPAELVLYSKKALPNSATSGSWGFQILPFIDQQPLYNAVDPGVPVAAYMCPGRGRPMVESGSGAWTDYFYNNYLNDPDNASRPDNPDLKRTLVGIPDGTAHTILLGHGNIPTNHYAHFGGVPFSSNIFLGGTSGTMRSGGDVINGASPLGVSLQRDSRGEPPGVGGWGGPFPQGGLMAMADGSVRMFPYQTANFAHFLTPAGGEVVILPP